LSWASHAGFTALRDVAGPVFGLKQAIDEGLVKGPRIFACGPGLAQTAGHGDMRNPNSKSTYFVGDRFKMSDLGYFWLAEGVAEVQKACRESLSKQAAFIKLCTGGGVTSLTDPLDSVQYTPEEVRAAVLEAERYGTYCAAHVHTDEGINVALDCGVKTIEHALLIKEDTVKRLVDAGAWVCPQLFIVSQPIEGNPVFANPIQKGKMLRARDGAIHAFNRSLTKPTTSAWRSASGPPYRNRATRLGPTSSGSEKLRFKISSALWVSFSLSKGPRHLQTSSTPLP
jgi:imidazolonepropionase-like amidohydrolase